MRNEYTLSEVTTVYTGSGGLIIKASIHVTLTIMLDLK